MGSSVLLRTTITKVLTLSMVVMYPREKELSNRKLLHMGLHRNGDGQNLRHGLGDLTSTTVFKTGLQTLQLQSHSDA